MILVSEELLKSSVSYLLLYTVIATDEIRSFPASLFHRDARDALSLEFTRFFIRKSLFCLSFNFLILNFTEINWLEWFTLSLIILYT